MRSGKNTALWAGKIALAVVSVLVLSVTGYGWAKIQQVNSGLTTTDVIDSQNQTDAGPQNILLVGIDTRTDAQGNPLPASILNQLHSGSAADGADATDTMIVIHIPAGGGKAIGFSIPRDSYVQLTGGYGMHKINSAYTYAEVAATKQLRAQGVTGAQLALQAAQAGAKNSIQTVEQFTGLQINHYAAVNLVGFYNISNAIGGVQVCLKQATKDSYSGANFPAGVQTIQGAQALAFVRQRHGLPMGDLDREKRQQVFLAAVAHQLISGGVLTDTTRLDNLIKAIQQSITLDKGWNVLSFAQQMQGMSAGNIQFSTIPIVNITYHTPTDGDAVEVDPQQVQAAIQAAINGPSASSASATPSNSAGGSSGGSSSSSGNSGITVDVANGTSTTGLAASVMQALVSDGFTQGSTLNSSSRSTTVIDYASGDKANADKVNQALGGGNTMVVNSSLSSGTVRVYLGRDYTGPRGASSGSTSTQEAAPSSAATPITANGVTCIN